MGVIFVILFLIYPWIRIDKINNEKILLMAEKSELDVYSSVIDFPDKRT